MLHVLSLASSTDHEPLKDFLVKVSTSMYVNTSQYAVKIYFKLCQFFLFFIFLGGGGGIVTRVIFLAKKYFLKWII